MRELRAKDLSYGAIGKLFKVSRQRVHQIVSGYVNPSNRVHWLNEFFEAILKRDNHICQKCEKGAILIHHIDKDNSNNNPSNLVALCNSCHLDLHREKERSKGTKKKISKAMRGKKNALKR